MDFSNLKTVNGFLYQERVNTDIPLSSSLEADLNLFQQVPFNLLRTHQMIPLKLVGKTLHVAISDVFNIHALDLLKTYVEGATVVMPLSTEASCIEQFLSHFYTLNDTRLLLKDVLETENAPKILECLLKEASFLNASDIHFQPQENSLQIKFRLEGSLENILHANIKIWRTLLAHLKIRADLDVTQKRTPQSGRFEIKEESLDLRLSTHPTLWGERAALRLLKRNKKYLKLEALGYDPTILNQLEKLLEKREGMIIFTGPTGSGKTTSLYALLERLATPEVNVMTLEDPVEYLMPGVEQTAISPHLNYAQGIRSILRQDPDVILIGEIRDSETATATFRAAMTGHLVLTTLHTSSVFHVFPRLNDLGISYKKMAGNIHAILSQRLIRSHPPSHAHRPHRFPIAECLILSPSLQDILANGTLCDLRAQAFAEGFVPLKQQAQRLLKNGLTTKENLKRVMEC